MEGTGKPEYEKCVEISTKAALREMLLPGALTLVMPILIGFTMGPEALGAYMAGVAVSGVLWAIFQNNAGGAWDNAKKSFEEGVMIDGIGSLAPKQRKTLSEFGLKALIGGTIASLLSATIAGMIIG